MTAAFTAFAAALQAFGGAWWKSLLGAALAFAPAFLLGQCSVDKDGYCKGVMARQAADAMVQDRKADDQASIERRQDDAEISNQSTEVKDATNALPDAPLTPRQHARACVLLRQQHAAQADLQRAGC